MYSFSSGKDALTHLNSIWRGIIDTGKPTGEICYRFDKLILKLNVIAEKTFIKTTKAHHLLLKCIQLTEQFQSKINEDHEVAFLQLTHLENCVDGLVQKAHEFRIKAG